MKSLRILGVAVIGMLLLTAGCATVPKEPKHPREALPDGSIEEAQKVADHFVNQLAEAINHNDFKKIDPAPFTKEFREKFNAQFFDMIAKRLRADDGKLLKHTYVCDLEQPLFRMYIWKFTFERKSVAADTKGQPLKFESLCRVLVSKVDGEYKIFGISL